MTSPSDHISYIMRHTTVAVLFILLGVLCSSAQNDPLFTQYWAVPSFYNPASTGTTDFVRIRGAGRLQWVGIENAPKSFMVTADSPFMVGRKRIGAGVNAMSESLGLFSNMQLNVQGSYKFRALGGTVSAGLQIGYYNSRFKGSEVYIPDDDDYHQGTDQSIPTQDIGGNAIDFSAGLLYSRRYFNVGVSVLHITDPTVKMSLEGTENNESQQYETTLPRTLYFVADGNIPLKNTLFVLQPSMMINTDFSDFSADLTMRSTYNKFISFGLSYRWKDSVSAMVGAEFKNFFLGYAYSYPLSAIARVSSGTHELMAGYSLKLDFSGKNKNKHRSIRIM